MLLHKVSKRQSILESSTIKNKEKWRRVIVPEMMLSDESGFDEDGKAVVFVKDLQWRSDKVGRLFEHLDNIQDQKKSEQALRQSKPRVLIAETSKRPPTDLGTIPKWAIYIPPDSRKSDQL